MRLLLVEDEPTLRRQLRQELDQRFKAMQASQP